MSIPYERRSVSVRSDRITAAPTGSGRLRRAVVLGAVAGFLALAGACSDSSTDPEPASEVEQVIEGVSASGASVSAQVGSPEEDPAAPSASVSGGTTAMIPGGGGVYSVTADDDFSTVYVSVDGREGHYELDFGSLREEVELALSYADLLEDPSYSLSFAVGTGSGAGPADAEDVEVVSVGTGDVQVSVAWDAPSDVDLHVVEPSGEEIYYGNRDSDSGGELDLDSNAACGGQDVRNENITWPDDAAPQGEYEVRVNYWADCGVESTDWVVTVRVGGQSQSFQGSFSGNGNGGGEGAGEVVTTFTY